LKVSSFLFRKRREFKVKQRERRALRRAKRAKTFHVTVRASGMLFHKQFATKRKADAYVARQRSQGHRAWHGVD